MNLERIRLIPALQTAVLLVDVQNSEIDGEHKEKNPWYYQEIIELERSLGIETIYTTIESLTSDDYEIQV